ncbi:GNAT family N-acetyltransferase [Natronomonas sp. CBA1123]|jgi:GNAT superfamily N-acetyltransferase|uniref:GNAT family N-acetyltransferase n=1 Tax=Natronomonas sp. CBA1123 TaxID=2668070 RepID=UPI0012EA2866|nr:GNAT family N-acetyltransferase [Natronomonas sp. CBA1123]MUV86299.1 GNAT family N-acetyltransferase [Natronomonas sp. CBA1123]
MTREYPDEVAGPYEGPPRSFADRDGRDIEIRRYDDEFETLVEMYLQFDPEDRAQGIPPTAEKGIRKWLDNLLLDECVNVVAWHGDDAVGHATLVPDTEGASELAIFVLREYQEAGIGTQLIECLLGAGRESGIEQVWLTVERWNKAATALYRKVGFEPCDTSGFELEMAAKLAA